VETKSKREIVQVPVTRELRTTGTMGIPEWWPSGHRVGVVLAHDIGFNQDQPLLVQLQDELTERGYLTIRFNFPYAEAGKKRPDSSQLLERCLRGAISVLLNDPQTAPAQLVIGGFGLGARVAAETVAHGLKADSLLCLGFPLHPSGKPSQQKAEFLFRLICPVLFVQGTRDPYCRVDRLQLLLRRIGTPTQLEVVEDADHTLRAIKRSTRSQDEVDAQIRKVVFEFLEGNRQER
jgi:predicted alpha/beta-hydrolase family hydrolase